MSKKKSKEMLSDKIKTVPISSVRAFAGQPRKHFNPEAMERLKSSIATHGQRNPCKVVLIKNPGKDGFLYELVGGERRKRAVELLGYKTIKIVILDNIKNEKEQYVESVLDNVLPNDRMAPLEEARAIKKMRDDGKPVKEISKMFGEKTEVWTYQRLKVLNELRPEVIALMEADIPEDERLNFSTGILLLSITDGPLQIELARKFVRQKMSMGQAKSIINKIIFSKNLKKAPRHQPAKRFKVINEFFDRTSDFLNQHLNLEEADLHKLLDSRPGDERRELLRRMENCERLTAQGIKTLKNTFGARGKPTGA